MLKPGIITNSVMRRPVKTRAAMDVAFSLPSRHTFVSTIAPKIADFSRADSLKDEQYDRRRYKTVFVYCRAGSALPSGTMPRATSANATIMKCQQYPCRAG